MLVVVRCTRGGSAGAGSVRTPRVCSLHSAPCRRLRVAGGATRAQMRTRPCTARCCTVREDYPAFEAVDAVLPAFRVGAHAAALPPCPQTHRSSCGCTMRGSITRTPARLPPLPSRRGQHVSQRARAVVVEQPPLVRLPLSRPVVPGSCCCYCCRRPMGGSTATAPRCPPCCRSCSSHCL